MVQGVATDRYAIGYSGIGYKTADVRALPLGADARSPLVPAEPEFAYKGEYPLARFLYVYVNYRPGGALDPVRREFLRYMFSQEGQQDVLKSGYLPLSGRVAREHAGLVGIDLVLREKKHSS